MHRIEDIRQQIPTGVERLTKRPDSAQRYDEKLSQCAQCGARTAINRRFCRECLKNRLRKRLHPGVNKWLHRWRRIAAEAIDRVLSLTVLAAPCLPLLIAGPKTFFWVFVGLHFTWHLLREFVSPGKKMMRLWVIQTEADWVNKRWPFIARRVVSAIVQTGYFLGVINLAEQYLQGGIVQPVVDWLVPGQESWNHFGQYMLVIGFSYDVMSLFCLMMDSQRRRLEDLITGTVVVDKEVYDQLHIPCLHCATLLYVSESVCGRCGRERPVITQKEVTR